MTSKNCNESEMLISQINIINRLCGSILYFCICLLYITAICKIDMNSKYWSLSQQQQQNILKTIMQQHQQKDNNNNNNNNNKTTTIKQQQNQIFNKDDICKELCAALYTLEEVMSQLRIKSGRQVRQGRQVGQAGWSGRQVRQVGKVGQVGQVGRSGRSGMQVWPVVEKVMSQLQEGRGYGLITCD